MYSIHARLFGIYGSELFGVSISITCWGSAGVNIKISDSAPASSWDKKAAVADGQMARYYWPGHRGHIARICYPRSRLICYFATSWFVASHYFFLLICSISQRNFSALTLQLNFAVWKWKYNILKLKDCKCCRSEIKSVRFPDFAFQRRVCKLVCKMCVLTLQSLQFKSYYSFGPVGMRMDCV